MQLSASAPARRHNKDVRDFCAKLVLKADNEVDEVILAAVHAALANNPGNPTFDAFRKEALEAHCKAHNMTVKRK